MPTDKRTKQDPIPANYREMLTSAQLLTLDKIESFGGELWFIRHPLFQDIIPVVRCSKTEDCKTAIIEEDGSLNKEHGLVIRD